MNRLLLAARVTECKAMRRTPAGIAALDLELAHEGQASEAGQARQVRLTLKAVAFGDVAEELQAQPLGQPLEFTGFLASASQRPLPSGASRTVRFHITSWLRPHADAAATANVPDQPVS